MLLPIAAMRGILLTTIFTLLLGSCSYQDTRPRVEPKGIAQEGFERSPYTAVQFEPGKSVLTDDNKKFLNEFSRKASRSNREISEIRILAWADREYPNKENEKAKTKEVILANERARVIRDYLRKDLKADEHIDIFNMAKRPGALDKVLRDEEFKVKQDVAKSGVSATLLPTGETSYTKAGKVLVIFDYKEDKK